MHIKKGLFQGITALGREVRSAHWAEDTTVFLSKAVHCTEFSLVSGLTMALFPLKECDHARRNGIPVKKNVTYLGAVVDKNEKAWQQLKL